MLEEKKHEIFFRVMLGPLDESKITYCVHKINPQMINETYWNATAKVKRWKG